MALTLIDTDFNLQTGVPLMVLTVLLQAAGTAISGEMDLITLLVDKGLSLAVLAWFVVTLKKSLNRTVENHAKEAAAMREEHSKEKADLNKNCADSRSELRTIIQEKDTVIEKKDKRIEDLVNEIIKMKNNG
jgi:hypothetical protein